MFFVLLFLPDADDVEGRRVAFLSYYHDGRFVHSDGRLVLDVHDGSSAKICLQELRNQNNLEKKIHRNKFEEKTEKFSSTDLILFDITCFSPHDQHLSRDLHRLAHIYSKSSC